VFTTLSREEELVSIIHGLHKQEVKTQFSLMVSTVHSMLRLIRGHKFLHLREKVYFQCKLSGHNIFKEFLVCLYLVLFDCKVQTIPAQTACTSGTAGNTSHSCHTGTCAGTAAAPSSHSRSGRRHSPCCSPPMAPHPLQIVQPFPTDFGLHFFLLERDCWKEWSYYLQT
jgi:hypothetical protein